jgi:CelD/BcsL family acetyltransferase involved in cellulose biosynthesis
VSDAQVVRIDPTRDPRWDAFVTAHPDGRLCDSSGWLEILARTFGYEPVHLAHEVGGVIDGVLPLCRVASPFTGNRLVSLPFSGPAGPFGTPDAVRALVAEAARLMSVLGCRYLNIRTSRSAPVDAFDGFTAIAPFVTSRVPLVGNAEVTWRRIPNRKVRQEIAVGRRQGLTCAVSDDRNDLRPFYRLFTETSRKHGIPPQPRRLFDAMWDGLHASGILKLFVTRWNGRVVTAQLCFAFGDVLSAGFVGIDYRFLKHHCVKVTDWGGIAWACQRGFSVYDFLQSHVDNRGLRWFKRSFGAVESPVTYYYYPRMDPTATLREALIGRGSPVAAVVKAMVRRLPAPGLRLLGELTYRHMG